MAAPRAQTARRAPTTAPGRWPSCSGAWSPAARCAERPGLASGKLLDDRDLQPTTDLRSLAKGLLGSHLGLNASAIARAFPASAEASAAGGLVRS